LLFVYPARGADEPKTFITRGALSTMAGAKSNFLSIA
jgi:hypothetical protein